MSDPTRYPSLSEYGMLSDAHSCALVSRSGAIDWLCLPRFDSPAMFARLLDWDRGGHWQIEVSDATEIRRRYMPGTQLLQTTFECPTGTAVLVDFMPVHPHPMPEAPNEIVVRERVVRSLRCLSGTVPWKMICRPRFDYGTFVPFLALPHPTFGHAHAGSHGFSLVSTVPMELKDDAFVAAGQLATGECAHVVLRYDPRYTPDVLSVSAGQVGRWTAAARRHWEDWTSHGDYDGPDRDRVLRSALVLKGLTYEPSGALVAAATTSLPEHVGGALNWDYRFTWLRDASFVLSAYFRLGYVEEAQAFLQWLDWTTVGRARDLQLMYGIGGERRLVEFEIPELEGWRGSKPVRVGNAAHSQFQLDVFGEVLDSVHESLAFTRELSPERWRFLARVAEQVSVRWRDPDAGIWEGRGELRHHVHSKVMAWVALDRAVRIAESSGLQGNLAGWKASRDEVRAEVLARGWNAERGAFVQSYDSPRLDAAVLQMPLVGFLPATDPRMTATIRAIQKDLCSPEGFVWRNEMHGPRGTEGTFLACTFWLVENLALLGDHDEARALFERASGCANDLGLFAEEVIPGTREPMGNFPQAFSHLGHILAATRLRRTDPGRGATGGHAVGVPATGNHNPGNHPPAIPASRDPAPRDPAPRDPVPRKAAPRPPA